MKWKTERLLDLLPILTEKKFILFYVPDTYYTSSHIILQESCKVDTICILQLKKWWRKG